MEHYSPIWVEQWPLTQEKLNHLNLLVEEQLNAGHIKLSVSPHNTPIVIIQKRDKNKWTLLHDLRAINAHMKKMGSLQPGLPHPSCIR